MVRGAAGGSYTFRGPLLLCLDKAAAGCCYDKEAQFAGGSSCAPYKVIRPYKDSKLAVNRLYVFLTITCTRVSITCTLVSIASTCGIEFLLLKYNSVMTSSMCIHIVCTLIMVI